MAETAIGVTFVCEIIIAENWHGGKGLSVLVVFL